MTPDPSRVLLPLQTFAHRNINDESVGLPLIESDSRSVFRARNQGTTVDSRVWLNDYTEERPFTEEFEN
jgi:hypothetical protein